MSILKILPNAIDSTANYVFGSVTSNGMDLGAAITAAFNAANTVSPLDSFARQTANAAFEAANTKLSTSGGTITGNLIVNAITANTITANGTNLGLAVAQAFTLANTANKSTTSNTAPINPNVGDTWFDTVTGVILRYTYDGVSNYWIDVSGPTNSGYIYQSYALTPNTSTINETTGNTVIYTVATTNTADNTVLYWTNSGTTVAADFSDSVSNGSVTITNNSATITRRLSADATTETSETIILSLRTGSNTGPVVAISPTVTVEDTSQTPQPLTFSFVSVAGGAGGGRGRSGGGGGGGGGAGGYISSVSEESSGGGSSVVSQITGNVGVELTVTIGAGGAGGTGSGINLMGQNGSNTSISGSGITTVTSIGGGGGGMASYIAAGQTGGSGGGAGGGQGAYAGGSGTTNQGYAGGSSASIQDASGGGGGAGQIGFNGTNAASGYGGNGGVGIESSISGTATYYAGGGGGGGASLDGTGGTGGGGSAGNPGNSGSTNTGGGGGGCNGARDVISDGGAGGSGIFIISYDSPQKATGGTITTSGGKTIHTFTSSGTFTVTG